MRFTVQRRIAADVLKCSPQRVRFSREALTDIKEAITKTDIRALIKGGAIRKLETNSTSRGAARKTQKQKAKGRQRGVGSRKGKASARATPKKVWMGKVRSQRDLIKRMRASNVIDGAQFRVLYLKVKGGFFRNQRHIKLFIEEQGFVKK